MLGTRKRPVLKPALANGIDHELVYSPLCSSFGGALSCLGGALFCGFGALGFGLALGALSRAFGAGLGLLSARGSLDGRAFSRVAFPPSGRLAVLALFGGTNGRPAAFAPLGDAGRFSAGRFSAERFPPEAGARASFGDIAGAR